MLILLFGAVFANDFIDIDCDKTCVAWQDDDNTKDCKECSKLGCTPDGNDCRPFLGCAWKDLLGDWRSQSYDVTCNFDEIEHWKTLMTRDTRCIATTTDCYKPPYGDSGGGIKNLQLYLQRNDKEECTEPVCPYIETSYAGTSGRYGAPEGTTCSLKCRLDNAPGGTRKCSVDPKKAEVCKKSCSIGNVACPDFSCNEVRGTWSGDYKGGKWDVCWDPFSQCGNSGMYSSGTDCCKNEILGIGTAAVDSEVKGKAAGCEDKCTCNTNRLCSKYTTVNGKRRCVKSTTYSPKCCGAMSLSLIFAIIAISLMF